MIDISDFAKLLFPVTDEEKAVVNKIITCSEEELDNIIDEAVNELHAVDKDADNDGR